MVAYSNRYQSMALATRSTRGPPGAALGLGDSRPLYAAGPTRRVPEGMGMTWEEEDWIAEEATAHRGPDE